MMTIVTERIDRLAVLESEIGVLMRRARRVIAERAQAVHPDLPGISYLMLGYIRDNGPVRATEVGAAFHVDKAAVSRHLQQMLEMGLLAKRPDPEDGRAMLISTTAEADERMRAIMVERRRWLDERLGEWGADELETLISLLGRYNRTLDEAAQA